jgi:AbiJ N-terminal domain 4
MINPFRKRVQDSGNRSGDGIPQDVWGGIITLVNSLVVTGAFGANYPEICPSDHIPIGTDEKAIGLAVQAEIPGLKWPLATTYKIHHGFHISSYPYVPDTQQVLDLIEFCYRTVAKPIQNSHHKELGHYHLGFDEVTGKQQFLLEINRILSRNKLMYELTDAGHVVKKAPGIPEQKLSTGQFHTGDPTLDKMLEEAHCAFLDPNPSVHGTSVKLLWDCWKRLQTLPEKVTGDEAFLSLLDMEAQTLTKIGDTFHLRHSDTKRSTITDPTQIDYMFHRLYSMIRLLLSQKEPKFEATK